MREGEVYPLKELVDRNQHLEKVVAERTIQLSEANNNLRHTNEKLEREIAERKLAAEALQTSEQRYRSIVNASPDDITITDREGSIVMVSPMAFTIFGYKADHEFLGRSILEFIVPEDRQRARAQMALKREGVLTGPTEYRGVRHDGSLFDIEVNSEFIRDTDGSPSGMVIIVRDISDRKRSEAEKEKLEAQNRQLQKAESLGRMAGAIAHHFNNQLQAVMLGLELAKGDLPPNAESRKHLAEATQSVRKAAEVSGLMLAYLGQIQSKQEPLDVSETCRSVLPMLRASIPNGGVIEADLPSPGPIARGNANQIQQVLISLVTNAWEAVENSAGVVHVAVRTVTAAEIPTADRFPVEWKTDLAAYACLEVTDAGCGIAEPNIERVFDPFFSTKFTGRGLGLSVALGIVRAHRGAITVQSKPGRGSVFQLFLPLSNETVRSRPAPKATAQKAANGSVLVVEDEPVVRTMLEHVLAQLGFAVHCATDGIEALEIFERRRSEICCVLSDLTMPRMGGWEMLAVLRKIAPGIPVILISGYTETQALERNDPERPNAFLRKPFKVEDLRNILAQILQNPELGRGNRRQ